MRRNVIVGLLGCALAGCGSFGKGLPTWESTFARGKVGTEKKRDATTSPQEVDIPVARPTEQNPVTLGAAISRRQVGPGEQIVLVVRCQTAKPWYIYAADNPQNAGIPTQLKLSLPPGISEAAGWQLPTATTKTSPVGEISTYAGDFRFTIPLQVSSTVPAGELTLQCEVDYQACNDSTCLAPGSQHLMIPLTVLP